MTLDGWPLARFYPSWEQHHLRIVRMIAQLTPDQLRLNSAQGMWDVNTLAAHIVANRAFWLHRVMREGPAELALWIALDDQEESVRTTGRLLEGLNETWAAIAAMLRQRTQEDLGATFKRRSPKGSNVFSRPALIVDVGSLL